MDLRIITPLLLLSLLLSSSSGIVEGFSDGTKRVYSVFHKDGTVDDVPVKYSRKLRELNHQVSDYDYAGSNPKHDPRKGKGNGKN